MEPLPKSNAQTVLFLSIMPVGLLKFGEPTQFLNSCKQRFSAVSTAILWLYRVQFLAVGETRAVSDLRRFLSGDGKPVVFEYREALF
jgi:hypothetical protein